MKRKTRWSKRILLFLLLPLFTIIFATIAYGAWQNYITFNINLTTAKEPTIVVACTLLNNYDNSITVFVNRTTKIIETTEPTFPLIYINVTNTGNTPIDRITLNDTMPNDWTLREVCMRLVQVDQAQLEINAGHFTIEFSSENDITLTISNIKNALEKNLNQNESIIINLYIEYNLVGQPLPTEYETNPPLYTNTVATIAWIGSWQSQPITSTLAFTTNTTES